RQFLRVSEDIATNLGHTLFNGQTVEPLHGIARKRAERLAQEVLVGDPDHLIRGLPRQKGGILLDKLPPHFRTHAPHDMYAKTDLEVIAREHGFLVYEVFSVGIGRDADVNDGQSPPESGRCRSFLQAIEFYLAKERALCDIAYISRWGVRVGTRECTHTQRHDD